MMALFPKVPTIQYPKAVKIDVTPLSFYANSPRNPTNIRINLECEKLESLGYIFEAMVWVHLH